MSQEINTIDHMESMAKNEADFTWSKRIDGKWLEVRWMVECGHWFRYKYGNSIIDRKQAAKLLEEC